MSVHSEFDRTVQICTDVLETSEVRAAERFASSLHAARAIAASDLSEAASLVLALAERTRSLDEIEFASPLDRKDFRERFDHMLAIARAILGRPPEA